MNNLHHKLLRTLLSLAFLLIVGRAPVASAVPLYFEGPDAWGFDPADAIALGIDHVVGGGQSWLSAGDPSLSPTLEVTTSLIGLIGAEPIPPSFATPLLGIVQYEVTNTTGSVLDGELLVFTLGAVDGNPDPWPFIEPAEFGLDSDGILIVHAAPYYFGAVALPTLARARLAAALASWRALATASRALDEALLTAALRSASESLAWSARALATSSRVLLRMRIVSRMLSRMRSSVSCTVSSCSWAAFFSEPDLRVACRLLRSSS